MREYIDPAVQHDMYRRAVGVCECEEPSHSHAPGKCGKDLGLGSGVLLPEGTKPDQHFHKGRLACPDCYRGSDSYFRQKANG